MPQDESLDGPPSDCAPSSDVTREVTLCIRKMQAGDELAREQLFEHIYDDLKVLARRVFRSQSHDHTLQPTALVHEAYLRLAATDMKVYADRRHFLCVAARAMRQLITDQARARKALKRGGDRQRVGVEPAEFAAPSTESGVDLLALDKALNELGRLNERQCRIVEMRFLAGLTIDETADAIGVAPRTVRADWTAAKSFLASRLAASE